ncbi:hypothetical protein [Pseudonocardia alaniniphila]|nr:hypothetical protein [Pseudonocardia alaniniphila]
MSVTAGRSGIAEEPLVGMRLVEGVQLTGVACGLEKFAGTI